MSNFEFGLIERDEEFKSFRTMNRSESVSSVEGINVREQDINSHFEEVHTNIFNTLRKDGQSVIYVRDLIQV